MVTFLLFVGLFTLALAFTGSLCQMAARRWGYDDEERELW